MKGSICCSAYEETLWLTLKYIFLVKNRFLLLILDCYHIPCFMWSNNTLFLPLDRRLCVLSKMSQNLAFTFLSNHAYVWGFLPFFFFFALTLKYCPYAFGEETLLVNSHFLWAPFSTNFLSSCICWCFWQLCIIDENQHDLLLKTLDLLLQTLDLLLQTLANNINGYLWRVVTFSSSGCFPSGVGWLKPRIIPIIPAQHLKSVMSYHFSMNVILFYFIFLIWYVTKIQCPWLTFGCKYMDYTGFGAI